MTERHSLHSPFSKLVHDYWLPDTVRPAPGAYRVVADPDLPQARSVMLLDLSGSGGFATLLPEIAQRAGLQPGAEVDASTLSEALRTADIELNGADHLFYFSTDEQIVLRSEDLPATVRQLAPEDAEAFEAFASAAPEDDKDEAFVELDHWLVFGCFVEERLVSAASMYPWSGTSFADLGVLTLPPFRGKGYGRQTVRAIAAQALKLGYEPQYRCQPDNRSSVSLAKASGLSLFAAWDVIQSEED